jgi:hypothetical protein
MDALCQHDFRWGGSVELSLSMNLALAALAIYLFAAILYFTLPVWAEWVSSLVWLAGLSLLTGSLVIAITEGRRYAFIAFFCYVASAGLLLGSGAFDRLLWRRPPENGVAPSWVAGAAGFVVVAVLFLMWEQP